MKILESNHNFWIFLRCLSYNRKNKFAGLLLQGKILNIISLIYSKIFQDYSL